nr:hypothetical protein CFP56_69659 [Quercus suber]
MFLPLRLWIGRKLFGYVGDPTCPSGVRVSPKRFVKWLCEAPELEGQIYAAENTTIPIPKVFRVHRYRGKLAIEMEYVKDCQNLRYVWRDLSNEQKHALVDEISGYMSQLRTLEPPTKKEYKISSTNGGPCRDVRVGSVKLFGPFENSSSFHECLRGGIDMETGKKSFNEHVIEIHAREYKSRFTHGDLTAFNILVRDGKVAAIIDWECAGWYPEYWEYTKAHYNYCYLPEFYDMLVQRIDRYDEELEAERELWRRWNQPLDDIQ